MGSRLTDQVVRAIAAPVAGNRVRYDCELPGFGVRTTAAGAKAFVLNYRTADGRERRVTIGSWPSWKTSAARERAKALRREIDTGNDPLAQREGARQGPTVATLAERYLTEHAPRKRTSSVAEDESMMRQHVLPRLGRQRVDAVRRVDIEAMHRAISKGTPIRANRVLALTSKMFSLAVAWEWRADNPCRCVEKNPENKRERYLTPAELQRLMAALAAHPYKSSANAIRLLLLTGARRNEVLGAQWSEFDMDAGTWVKPATRTKAGKPHRVPLSAPARQLLADMRAKAEGDALFPGRRGEAQTTLKTFWKAVCRTAKLRDLRTHDLRHAFASHLASNGQSLLVIGQLLGHSQVATTQRYSHLFDDVQRRAVESVGSIVVSATSDAAPVIPLRRSAR
jgi:integrase